MCRFGWAPDLTLTSRFSEDPQFGLEFIGKFDVVVEA